MPQSEVAVVGRLNNKAIVTEEGALLVKDISGGGGGGGGGITKAEAQEAFENALDSRHVTQAQYRTPVLKRVAGMSSGIYSDCYSFSVANVGSVNITVNIGISPPIPFILKPNEVINLEAGAANNFFTANSITIDATASGAEAILTYIV